MPAMRFDGEVADGSVPGVLDLAEVLKLVEHGFDEGAAPSRRR